MHLPAVAAISIQQHVTLFVLPADYLMERERTFHETFLENKNETFGWGKAKVSLIIGTPIHTTGVSASSRQFQFQAGTSSKGRRRNASSF
jgi:hypothetical protein